MEIYYAEGERASGTTRGLDNALRLARRHGAVEPKAIADLPEAKGNELMGYWRIWAVAAMTRANRVWQGPVAAAYLHEAHDVISTFYYSKPVWERAVFMRRDANGNEYQMAAEMCRDEAKYWSRAGSLLGIGAMQIKAIEVLDGAIENLATPKSSVHSLATVERAVLQRKVGLPVNYDMFNAAYHEVVVRAFEAGGWDRQAAVSWEFMREHLRLGNFDLATRGLHFLRQACHALGKNWLVYPQNELLQSVSAVSRKRTGAGEHTKALSEGFKLH